MADLTFVTKHGIQTVKGVDLTQDIEVKQIKKGEKWNLKTEEDNGVQRHVSFIGGRPDDR